MALPFLGCDPLALPLAALLYQQASNHWLRKLAPGREMYLIPTGDIASVVFMTELLNQFRNRDGKMVDKTSSTKYIAQVIAQHMEAWIPPYSQQEITQLRQQVGELRQRVGDDSSEVPPSSSPAPESSAAHLSPIQRSFQGANAPPAPPSFEPTCLLTIQGNSNSWLENHLPTSLAKRTINNCVNHLNLSQAKKNTVQTNLEKAETWWSQQPAGAMDTIQKVAIMMCIPINLLQKNFDASQVIRVLTIAITMAN